MWFWVIFGFDPAPLFVSFHARRPRLFRPAASRRRRRRILGSLQSGCDLSSFKQALSSPASQMALVPRSEPPSSEPGPAAPNGVRPRRSALPLLPSLSAIGPLGASVSAGQITAVTLANHTHTRARAQTGGLHAFTHRIISFFIALTEYDSFRVTLMNTQ